MQQRIVFGVIIAVIAISIIVFVLYQAQEAQPLVQDYPLEFEDLPPVEDYYTPVEPGSILSECGQQETEYKRDLCWLFEAGKETDASKCLNIAERPRRIDCIRAVARDFESAETKQRIANCEARFSTDTFEERKQLYACLDEMLPEMKQEKLAICNQFLADDQQQVYMCRSEIARDFIDYDICDAMPTQPIDYKEHCHFIVDMEVA